MKCARTQYMYWVKAFRIERTPSPVNVLGRRAVCSPTQYLYWVSANSSNPVHVRGNPVHVLGRRMQCARTQYMYWVKAFRLERTPNPVNVLGRRAVCSPTQYLYWVSANSSNPVHVLGQAKIPKNAYPPNPPMP